MSPTTAPKIETWALVELMGHQRLAGLVSEATFPGGFVRIDVYADDPGDALDLAEPVFTRIVSPSALYAINPVERAIALELAKRYTQRPVQAYELSNLLPKHEPGRDELQREGSMWEGSESEYPYEGPDEEDF